MKSFAQILQFKFTNLREFRKIRRWDRLNHLCYFYHPFPLGWFCRSRVNCVKLYVDVPWMSSFFAQQKFDCQIKRFFFFCTAFSQKKESWRYEKSSRLIRNLSNCDREAWKKIQASAGFEPVTSAIPVQCSTNWAVKPQMSGAGQPTATSVGENVFRIGRVAKQRGPVWRIQLPRKDVNIKWYSRLKIAIDFELRLLIAALINVQKTRRVQLTNKLSVPCARFHSN